MKQTVVEWLVEQVNSDCLNSTFIRPDIIEQSKATEKERMIDFAKYCLNNAKYLNFDKVLFNVEEYYQIFKSK